MTQIPPYSGHNDENTPLPASRAPVVVPISAPKNAVTPEEMDVCVNTFRATGLWNHSCRQAGRHPRTFNELRRTDSVFDERVRMAHEDYVEFLELEAHRKAVEGTVEKTYDKDGNLIRERTIKSDRMHEVLLRANAPQKYRENTAVDPNIIAGVLVVERAATSHEDFMARFAKQQEVGEAAKRAFLTSQEAERAARRAAAAPQDSQGVKGNS